jgi:hypothetical protein
MNKTISRPWRRRDFLRCVGGGMTLGAAARLGLAEGAPSPAGEPRFLKEHGFWEYTTPCAGGFEAYGLDDYRLALDDMAGAGMNSLLIVVKWFTTGYRSKLPYLDQLPGNRVIESDNELLRKVMAEAKARRIKMWLGAVTSYYDAAKFGSTPCGTISWAQFPFRIGTYDPDAPEAVERGAAIFEEILEQFPGPDGLMLEMESIERPAPHRIPCYNEWAKANNRPPYDDPQTLAGPHWFDYQTASIVKATHAVEKAVRGKGFRGDLATINKILVNSPIAKDNQAVNLQMMRRDCPAWATINYWYDKGEPNGDYAWYMKPAVSYPKSLGMNVYYLSRGVMTWGNWRDRQRLERSWTQDVADVLAYQPQNYWWFGAGSKGDGLHTSLKLLKEMGFADDVAARRALLKTAAPLRSATA